MVRGLNEALKTEVIFSGWGANGITLVLDKILTFLIEKWTLPPISVEKDLEKQNTGMKLRLMLLKIRSAISAAMETGVSEPWLVFWLNQLENEAYKTEDLIDVFEMDPNNNDPNEIMKKMNEQIIRMHDIINGNYSEAIRELEMLRNFQPTDTSSVQSCDLGRARKEVANDIITKVVQLKPTGNLLVQSIVGVCGIGKTAVAQHVYNDYNIKGRFEHRVWISMHRSFKLDTILKAFMESATREKFDILGSDANEVRFQNYIRGKRIFLVLDGVWQESRSDWSSFFALLNVGTNGCAVLVTTQSSVVASIIGSKRTHVYVLPPLLEEGDLMQIFESNAFKSSQEKASDFPKLMVIGKEIVRKCYGNPMFIKTIGEFLFDKRDKKEWQFVDTNFSELLLNGSSISEVLRLSYSRLPSYLKLCISYCALFSKGFEFDKPFLTKLWLAEDLIQSKGNIKREELADLYFDELVIRSYFQTSDQQGYKLHELVYEMVKIIGLRNPFKAKVDDQSSLSKQSKILRYLSLDYQNGVDMNDIIKFKELRTIILMCPVSFTGIQHDHFEKLNFIRVLDLSKSNIAELPSSIRQCKYLKYLDVSGTIIQSIGDGVCELYLLQTLKIKGCTHLKRLPGRFGDLVNIQHLDMEEETLDETPVNIGRLTKLHELKKYVIRNLNGCSSKELVGMNQLQGSLCVEGVESASYVEDHGVEPVRYLDKKDNVQKLKLRVKDQSIQINEAKLGFELSRPSPKLLELIVEDYFWGTLWEWDWISLGVETIDLIGCSNLTCIRGLRELPRLKKLKLSGLNVIGHLDSSFFGQEGDVGFSLLNTLILDSWNQWETWDGVGKYMLNIERLCIQNCPVFRILPELIEWRSLTILVLQSCHSLANCQGRPPPNINFFTPEDCPALNSTAWPIQMSRRN